MWSQVRSWLPQISTKHKAPLLFALLLGICLAQSRQSVAQQPPIRYETYLAMIGEMRGEALNAQSRQGDSCNQRLRALSNELNSITQILMPDGQIVTVDHAQAGLPTSFPYCNPVNFVRFLNGICPEAVCLTTGVVVQPEEIEQRLDGSQTTLVDLVDFENSEPLPQSVPTAVSDSGEVGGEGVMNEGEINEGGIGEEANGEGESGDGTVSEEANGEEGSSEGASSEEGTAVPVEVGEGGDEDAAGVKVGEAGGTAVAEAVPSTSEAGELAESEENESSSGQGEEETAVVEAEEEEPVRAFWLLIVIGTVMLTGMIGLVLTLRRSNETSTLRPETVQKVEENVASGRRLLSEGEYREAIHKLFNATLRILEDRNLLRFDKAYTNYELLGAATTAPLLVHHLSPVIDAYDRVWYGYEPLATSEFEALVEQIEQLKTIQR